MKSAGTRIAEASRQAESGYAKARNQDSGTPCRPTSPVDVRSVRRRRGGCCAHTEDVEETHEIERDDQRIAPDSPQEVAHGCRGAQGGAAIGADSGASRSASFANDRSGNVLRG